MQQAFNPFHKLVVLKLLETQRLYDHDMNASFAYDVERICERSNSVELIVDELVKHTTTLEPLTGRHVSKFFQLFDVLEFGSEFFEKFSSSQKNDRPLLTYETRKALADALLLRVKQDPKILLHFSNSPKEVFHIAYPHLFPPAKAAHKNSFTFFYDGLLQVLLSQMQMAKQRHVKPSTNELLGAAFALDQIVRTEQACDKNLVAQIYTLL